MKVFDLISCLLHLDDNGIGHIDDMLDLMECRYHIHPDTPYFEFTVIDDSERKVMRPEILKVTDALTSVFQITEPVLFKVNFHSWSTHE